MESAPVRWVLCAVLLCAFAPGAAAQEFGPALRGTQPITQPNYPHWGGFYFGGDVDFGGGNITFSNVTQAPLAYALRDTVIEQDFDPSSWPLVGNATVQSAFPGAFAGYDMQWEDIILGAEATYAHPNVTASAPSTPMGRSFTEAPDSNGNITEYVINGSASASLRLTDYATLRARAGWAVNNIFLPYGFFGLALGRGTYSTDASVAWTQVTSSPTVILTQTSNGITVTTIPAVTPSLPCTGTYANCTYANYEAGNTESGNVWLYGFDAGVGVDIALLRNVFLRGEFEYVHFFPEKGITLDLATARAGVGVKF